MLINFSCSYSLLAEVLDGIKIYFDFTLKDHLLHNDIEMGQYEHMLTVGHVTSNGIDNEGVGPIRPAPPTPSSVYGPIHLLRLFGEWLIVMVTNCITRHSS